MKRNLMFGVGILAASLWAAADKPDIVPADPTPPNSSKVDTNKGGPIANLPSWGADGMQVNDGKPKNKRAPGSKPDPKKVAKTTTTANDGSPEGENFKVPATKEAAGKHEQR